MTARKIFIRFCKFCNEINKRAGQIFVLCRVEFSKIGKHDITFIREMRVSIILAFINLSSSPTRKQLKFT